MANVLLWFTFLITISKLLRFFTFKMAHVKMLSDIQNILTYQTYLRGFKGGVSL